MTHPLLKKLFWFFLFILLGGVFFFPYSALAKRLFKLSVPHLEAAGVNVEPQEISMKFPGTFVLSNVRVTPRSVPVPVLVDHLELDPGYLRSLVLQPSLNSTWHILGGIINADIASSYRRKQMSADIQFHNLALDAHPLGKFFGVVGNLSGEAHATNYPYEVVDYPAKYSATLQLSQGSFIGGYQLAGVVTLPAVTDVNVQLGVFCEEAVCTVKNVNVQSSLLSGSGQGKFSFGENLFRRMDMNFFITLTDAGKKALGGYLALATQKDPSQIGADWNIQILKEPNGALRTSLSSGT